MQTWIVNLGGGGAPSARVESVRQPEALAARWCHSLASLVATAPISSVPDEGERVEMVGSAGPWLVAATSDAGAVSGPATLVTVIVLLVAGVAGGWVLRRRRMR